MTSASAFHFASLVWDWPIAIYLFLIGISAGLVTLAILLRRFHPEAGGSDSTLLRTTLVLGPGAIILGLLILVFHLTRPWTFWKLMFHYSFTSVMSMGVMLFQLYMVVLVLWLAKIFEKEVIALQQRWLPRLEIVQKVLALITPFHRALETLMLVLAVLLGAYTGFLLSALKSYPFLNNPILPALFLFSGISSGAAVALIAMALRHRSNPHSTEARFVHRMEVPVVWLEIFLLAAFFVGLALGVGDAKQLGRIGAKTILYFELITTVAIILGITLANVFQPGSGIDMSQLATVDISKYQNTTAEVQSHAHGLMGTILSLVPTNIIASMAKGDMLPIIFFSVLFGLGLSSLPATHREPLVTVFRSISETMFKVTHMVMRYAPVGVFALIAVTVANFGFASLWPLAKLVLLVHFAIIFFALVVLGIVARLCGLSIWILIRILKDELILAYSTASSESVLPRIIEKMEAYGAPASITSFVVPTGYSFNLDGSTLYQSIAAIFIAQLYGIDLSLWQEIVLVLTLMVTSKGIAGVPGVSFVVLLATLGSVGIPLEGLAFIAGVDRILDMARTALNVVGNALAVLVIAKWEHKFDRKKALAYERDVLGKFDKTAQ